MVDWNLASQLLLGSGRVHSTVVENEVRGVMAFMAGVDMPGVCVGVVVVEVNVVDNDVAGVVVDVDVEVSVVGEGDVVAHGV